MNQAILENELALVIKENNPDYNWFRCQQEARKAYRTFLNAMSFKP